MDAVELFAKFGEQRSEIGFVLIAGGKFPINIEAIEDAGLVNAGSEVAADVHVDAAFDEGFAIGGKRGGAELYGVGAASAQRDDDLEVRVAALEFLKLMEISDKGVGSRAIGLAVYSLVVGERNLIVGPGVEAGAGIILHIGEGVVEVGKQRSGTAGDEVFDEIIGIDAPLREIADDVLAMMPVVFAGIVRVLRARWLCAGYERGQEEEGSSKTERFHKTSVGKWRLNRFKNCSIAVMVQWIYQRMARGVNEFFRRRFTCSGKNSLERFDWGEWGVDS